jgi:ribosomal protein S18 acetylase RimI-like enzyme
VGSNPASPTKFESSLRDCYENEQRVSDLIMIKIKIRKFRKADAEQVLSLNYSLSEMHGATTVLTVKQLVQACLEEKLAKCFVAEADRKIIGFAISYDWINFGYGTRICAVDQLYTHEKFRRLGVALFLVRRIAEDSIKRGCFRMEVLAAKDNEASNAFYKAAGFFLRMNKSNKYVLQDESLHRFVQPVEPFDFIAPAQSSSSDLQLPSALPPAL